MGSKRIRNQRPKFVISWCRTGTVTGEFSDSIAGTYLYDVNTKRYQMSGDGGGFISIRSSPRLAEARNRIVTQFLSTPDFDQAQYLVMLDTDMVWAPGSVHGIVDAAEVHGFGIMGGLCFGASDINEECYPTLYIVDGQEEDGSPKVTKHTEIADNMIMEVDATGAACIAIHRKLLEHMAQPHPHGFLTDKNGVRNPYPWFAEGVNAGRQVGEDIAFCLRARSLRYRVGVHTGYEFGHIKTRAIGRAQYEAFRRKHDDGGAADHADHEQPDPGGEAPTA